MSVREGIEFETVLESDTAPLTDLVRVMLDACPSIRAMRDPTRGGVSSALNGGHAFVRRPLQRIVATFAPSNSRCSGITRFGRRPQPLPFTGPSAWLSESQ